MIHKSQQKVPLVDNPIYTPSKYSSKMLFVYHNTNLVIFHSDFLVRYVNVYQKSHSLDQPITSDHQQEMP